MNTSRTSFRTATSDTSSSVTSPAAPAAPAAAAATAASVPAPLAPRGRTRPTPMPYPTVCRWRSSTRMMPNRRGTQSCDGLSAAKRVRVMTSAALSRSDTLTPCVPPALTVRASTGAPAAGSTVALPETLRPASAAPPRSAASREAQKRGSSPSAAASRRAHVASSIRSRACARYATASCALLARCSRHASKTGSRVSSAVRVAAVASSSSPVDSGSGVTPGGRPPLPPTLPPRL